MDVRPSRIAFKVSREIYPAIISSISSLLARIFLLYAPLYEEVQQACLRKGVREVVNNLLSHQVAASALCRKMEGGLSDHIYMDEMSFVCKFKIIILILMHMECIIS